MIAQEIRTLGERASRRAAAGVGLFAVLVSLAGPLRAHARPAGAVIAAVLVSVAIGAPKAAAQTVIVIDNTELVRDEVARASFMTDARGWDVIVPTNSSDLDGDGVVGTSDLIILLGQWGPCDECNDCVADIDGDCLVGVADLLILLANWG